MCMTIFAGSTSDGKVYHMIVCECGRQDSSGRCEHVKNPVIVETVPMPQFVPTAPWSPQ